MEEESMKRMLIISIVTILMSGSLFAAGSQETSSSDALTIEVAIPSSEESQVALTDKVFQKLISDYNKAHGTEHTVFVSSNQKMDLLNTRMSSNDKPDIFLLDSPADVNQYAKDGLLLDLTSYVKADNWEGTMFDWAYDLAKVDGKVVTLPYGYEGMVLWYNKKIMKELGLNPADITTLKAYENALQKASDAGYIPVMLGSQDWPWAQEWYLSIMFSYTGRPLLKNVIEGKDPQGWNNPAFKKTVALYKSWHDKGYLADGRSFILTSDDAINAFTSDKALFKLEGTWAPYWITPLDKADQEKIGVMLHPAIGTSEKPHLPLAVGGMWCASSETDAPEAAAALISGLLSQDFQGAFLENGMDVAPMPIDASQFENLMPNVKQMWSLVNNALANGSFGYTTWAFFPPETRVYAYEGIVNVLEEKISIDDYLAEMQRLNTKELQQGFKPVLPSSK